MNIHASPPLRWLVVGLVLAVAGCGIVPKKTEIAIYDPQTDQLKTFAHSTDGNVFSDRL